MKNLKVNIALVLVLVLVAVALTVVTAIDSYMNDYGYIMVK